MHQLRGCIREIKEITLPGYIQMYTGVHSDVAQESYLFDMPLIYPWNVEKAGIYGLCIPVDSFDLRC